LVVVELLTVSMLLAFTLVLVPLLGLTLMSLVPLPTTMALAVHRRALARVPVLLLT
jgi:hypothetical protein